MSEQAQQIKPEVKSIFIKAHGVALEQVEKAQESYKNIMKQPTKSNGEKLLEAVVDVALAKAKIEYLQEAYTAEGGGEFPQIY